MHVKVANRLEGRDEKMSEIVAVEQVKKSKKNKKKLPAWVIFPILGVVALIVVGITLLVPQGETIQQVEYITIEKGDIRQEYTTSGLVESQMNQTYYAPSNAPVQEITTQVGQVVKKGDVLVSFDTKDLEKMSTQTDLNLTSVLNTNADAQNQAAQAQQLSANSIAQLEGQISEKESQLSQLKKDDEAMAPEIAALIVKITELEQKKKENLNSQSEQIAIKENAELELQKVSDTDPKYQELLAMATTATTTISNLEIELRTIEAELLALGTPSGGTATQQAQLQQEIDALRMSLEDAKTQAASTSGISQAQKNNMAISQELAEIEQLSAEQALSLAKLGIVAETDGVVSQIMVQEGGVTAQGSPIITLVSNEEVEVSISVPTSDFDKLIEGNEAEITLGASKYQGILEEVDKIAMPNDKGTPSISAKVRITNPDDSIFIGVEAKVNLAVASAEGVVVVPTAVTNVSTEGDFVYVMSDGIVEKRFVQLGVYDHMYSEVVDGLEEGDMVIDGDVGELEGKSVLGIEKQGV